MNLIQFTKEQKQARSQLEKMLKEALADFDPREPLDNNECDVNCVSELLFEKLKPLDRNFFADTETVLYNDLIGSCQFHKITYQGFEFIVQFEFEYKATYEDFCCSPLQLTAIISIEQWKQISNEIKEQVNENEMIATLFTHYSHKLPNESLQPIFV